MPNCSWVGTKVAARRHFDAEQVYARDRDTQHGRQPRTSLVPVPARVRLVGRVVKYIEIRSALDCHAG